MFFSYKDIRNYNLFGPSATTNSGLNCLGCKITHYLRLEHDHYKSDKRKIVRRWLYNGQEWNDNDLDKALLDYEARGIMYKADDLDRKRDLDMNHTRLAHCIDHEYDERQNPIVERWGMAKHNIANRQSPLVSNKDMDSESNPWNWHRMDRRHAH